MIAIRAGRWTGLAAVVAVTVMAVGCSRGPDATALQAEVQGKLDQRFKPGLFGLVGFRRQGSAPLPGSEAGGKRMAVYFKRSTLVLADAVFQWGILAVGDSGCLAPQRGAGW